MAIPKCTYGKTRCTGIILAVNVKMEESTVRQPIEDRIIGMYFCTTVAVLFGSSVQFFVLDTRVIQAERKTNYVTLARKKKSPLWLGV